MLWFVSTYLFYNIDQIIYGLILVNPAVKQVVILFSTSDDFDYKCFTLRIKVRFDRDVPSKGELQAVLN